MPFYGRIATNSFTHVAGIVIIALAGLFFLWHDKDQNVCMPL